MDDAFTYPDLLQICERGLSCVTHDLVDGTIKNKILEFATLLPQGLRFPLFGFECPLSRDEAWGDIGFYINLLEETSIHDLEKLPKSWQQCPGWNRLSALGKAYYHRYFSSDELAGFTHIVPIEFDVGSSKDSPHTPSIFFMLKKEQKLPLAQLLENHKAFFDVTKDSLALIEHCSDSLPQDGNILSIGFMLSRPQRTPIKIGIGGKGLTAVKVVDFFEKLGMPCSVSMQNIVGKLVPFAEGIAMSVDIAEDKFRERVAVEFIFSQNQSINLQQWQSCFEVLHEASVIKLPKHTGCLEWCGHSLDFIGNSRHPPYFFLSLYRTISHVKIIYVPNRGIEAKIYLKAKLDIIQRDSLRM